MAGIINTGSPYVGSVKRTNPKSLDSSETHATKQQAHLYARNANGEDVPYPGQIISAEGQAYILKIDPEMPDESDKEIYHCYLDPLGGNNDNDDRYVRKDIAETIEKLMTFIEGINVKGTATLNEIVLLNNIISKNFSPGGNGFGIYQDEDGNYHLDIDFVDIRKKLRVEEIQVQESTYIGGKQYNTGGGMICNRVEDMGTYWRCYFKTTDADGRTVYNTFQADDQAICEVFNLKSGSHYYWRLLVGKGDDYIDLSKSDCATGSDAPLVGDSIVQLGNRTDISRQGAIVWDSVTAGGPYVRIYKGINSYTMPEPLIDFNTVLSEITAKFINEATGKDIDETIGDMQANMDIIKQQTDKEYTLWFYDYEPSLSNLPASEWKTAELKKLHDQDMFYNRLTGKGYRFEDGAWEPITDHLTLKALEDAARAQDTADSKRRVFVAQPTAKDAYDVGDLWVNATYNDGTTTYKNDALVCKTAKAAGAAFSISHWKPSSTATTAYIENLGDRITIAVTNSEDGIAAAKELARQGINDAYDAAQSALQALGIAQGAQSTADQNTAAIQVTKDSISALVQGIHINASGNITNIDTSGLVTTDDFNVLLSKKVNFDSGGHITNISTSGLVTESSFAQMFSEKAYADGYVKRAEISTFITEDEAGRLISNAVISAEQIKLEGLVTANSYFKILEDGSMEAAKGTFRGDIIQGNGINAMHADGSVSFCNGKISWGINGIPTIEGKIVTASNGNRIEIDAETNSLKMYNENGYKVFEIVFRESSHSTSTNPISHSIIYSYDVDSNGDIISTTAIQSNSIFIESRQFDSDVYALSLSPFGIDFRKNNSVTKSYPKE